MNIEYYPFELEFFTVDYDAEKIECSWKDLETGKEAVSEIDISHIENPTVYSDQWIFSNTDFQILEFHSPQAFLCGRD